MDWIRVTGMQFYAFHGDSSAEQATGRQYEVDCELGLDLRQAGESDDVADTIDYSHVYALAEQVMRGQRRHLLEALAHEIANHLLNRTSARTVRVRVRKLHPPVDGTIAASEVAVERPVTS